VGWGGVVGWGEVGLAQLGMVKLGLGLDVGMVEVALTMPQLRLTVWDGEDGVGAGVGVGRQDGGGGVDYGTTGLTIGEDGVGAGGGRGDGGGGVDYW